MTDDSRPGPDRRNSFDAVRLAAALAVVLAHQLNIAGYTLPGYGQPSVLPFGPKLADAGLYVFFALSGYLVFQSLDGDPRPGRFLLARALRIYPGVAVNVLLCVLVGGAVTALPAAAYWGAPGTWRFLAQDVFIPLLPTAFQLPGVITESPWPSVNVPLWTLKYEVLCYLVLLAVYGAVALAGGGRRARFRVLAVAAAVMAAWFAYDRAHPAPPTGGLDTLSAFSAVHVVRFFAVFFSGAALAATYAAPGGAGARRVGAAALGAAVLLGPTPELRFVATSIAIGLGAVLLGRSRLLYSRAYHRVGDLSYGTYLYAFPIQMFTLSRWLTADNFWLLTLVDVLLALGCACLSWRLVERPALRLKRRRGAEAQAPALAPAA